MTDAILQDIAKDLQTNDQIPDFDLLTTLAHSSFSGDYSPTALVRFAYSPISVPVFLLRKPKTMLLKNHFK